MNVRHTLAALGLAICLTGGAVAQPRLAPQQAEDLVRLKAAKFQGPVRRRPAVPAFVVRGPSFSGNFFTPAGGSIGFFNPQRSGFANTTFCPQCGGFFPGCNCGGSFILPPVFVDSSEVFGPRAAIRFFGTGQPPANNRPVARRQAGPLLPPEPPLKPFNARARGRAWKFIGFGDKQFRDGEYREAIRRYRKAAATDRELGETHFRQGWAELLLGNRGRASVAFRRGLRLDADWPSSDFVLEELLDAEQRTALQKQLDDQLADAPNDIDTRFLRAVARHFNGDPAAAQRDFVRVARQTGGDPATMAFLPPEEEKVEPEPGN